MARRLNADASTVLLTRLDEPDGGDPVDVGSSGLVCTNSGSTAVAATGVPYTVARQFARASSQHITISSCDMSALTSISIEAWVKLESINSTWQPIFTRSNGTLELLINDTGIFLGVWTAGGGRSRLYSPTMSAGVWYWLAAAYTGRYFYQYVNGELVDAYDCGSTDNMLLGTSTSYLGGRYNLGTHLDGQLAEVRISNRLRTPWEIYNTYAAVSDPQAGFTVEGTGTVAVYNFNNPSEGAIVYDDTGNHNGTVSGSVPLATGSVSSVSRTFDGSNSNYLIVPHHADFKIDQDLTIEAWVSVDDLITNKTILNKGDISATPDLCFNFAGTGPYLFISSGPTDYIIANAAGTMTPVANTLYYVAVTFDFSIKRLLLYINGVFLVSNTEVGTYTSGDTTRDLQIGVRFTGNSEPMTGKQSAIRWSNYIKTPKEIFDYYNGSNIKYRLT